MMTIEEVKRIAIADYLQSMGITPDYRKGNNLWYKSPLRQERTASFKVNTDRNMWYDFGLGKGGNIISLASELYQTNDVARILANIEKQSPVIQPNQFFSRQPKTPSPIRLEKVVSLSHPALLQYIRGRGVSIDIACKECKEVHYSVDNKRYFTIGFANASGGYELRNQLFKNCLPPKDATFIKRGTDACHVFEGFMDYLSFLSLQGCDQSFSHNSEDSFVILNSVSILHRVIPFLQSVSVINTYMDNDTSGQNATERIRRECSSSQVIDHSIKYAEYNDLNDYLRGKTLKANVSRVPEKVEIKPKTKGIRR